MTHRLREVLRLADRVTVLRSGRLVESRPVAGLNHESLVEMIVGRTVEPIRSRADTTGNAIAFTADRLAGGAVKDVSFTAAQGEIVGIAGLAGSGFDQVLALTFGAAPRTAGTVRVGEVSVRAGRPSESILRGMAFAPADRKVLGSMQDWSVKDNITLPRLNARRGGFLSERAETVEAQTWIGKLDVQPPDPAKRFANLSGGNQQKVVLARWLRCRPNILLLDEPTNGVDAGSKASIYAHLAEVAATGAAVVISSSDSEELAAVCDRVVVVLDGVDGTVLSGDELTSDAIVRQITHHRDLTTASGTSAS